MARQSEALQPVTTRVSNDNIRNSKKLQGRSLPFLVVSEQGALSCLSARRMLPQVQQRLSKRTVSFYAAHVQYLPSICSWQTTFAYTWCRHLFLETTATQPCLFESFSPVNVVCRGFPAANRSSNRHTHRARQRHSQLQKAIVCVWAKVSWPVGQLLQSRNGHTNGLQQSLFKDRTPGKPFRRLLWQDNCSIMRQLLGRGVLVFLHGFFGIMMLLTLSGNLPC